jgi:hypothetical protein
MAKSSGEGATDVPGWPDFAACTSSFESVPGVSIASCSILEKSMGFAFCFRHLLFY